MTEVLPLPRDGGNMAPMFVRFGFHVGGMYNRHYQIGGASQAPIRFSKGWFTLVDAFVEPWQLMVGCHNKFPYVSWADMFTLGAAAAVEFAGGPEIPWVPGRLDNNTLLPIEDMPLIGSPIPSDTPTHMWEFFTDRLGMTDQDTAAMMGGHGMGFAHGAASGVAFEGVWSNKPFNFTNLYYQELMEYDWMVDDRRGPDAPPQWTNLPGKEYMMFNIDMLTHVKEFHPFVERYASDQDAFFEDFKHAYNKCLELGVVWEEEALEARSGKALPTT